MNCADFEKSLKRCEAKKSSSHFKTAKISWMSKNEVGILCKDQMFPLYTSRDFCFLNFVWWSLLSCSLKLLFLRLSAVVFLSSTHLADSLTGFVPLAKHSALIMRIISSHHSPGVLPPSSLACSLTIKRSTYILLFPCLCHRVKPIEGFCVCLATPAADCIVSPSWQQCFCDSGNKSNKYPRTDVVF